jgi:glycosyltransferase involved in cell wall biosynthesis
MRHRVAASPLASPLRIPESPVPGVNLAGFLEGESGLGEVARRLGAALRRAGIPLSAISYRRTASRQQHRPDLPLTADAPYDTNVVCLNADTLAQFATDVGIDFFANRYSIGVWFWETNVFRAEDRAAARLLDEIWVASDYVRHAIAPEVDIPVHVVPVPVEPPPGPFLSKSELDLPDAFTFLFLFDFVSAERKNPTMVVEAFTRAFAPGEGPTLVLKSINGRERKRDRLEELLALAEGRDDVVVRDGYVPPAERDSYVAACDCYVSLHRSEGFGLTLTEAMACGKPVIATGYSGNLDFMSQDTSYLVPYRLVEIPDEWWAYVEHAQWAEPDVSAAADLMRLVYENQSDACERGERGRAALLSTHSMERAANFIVTECLDAHEHLVDQAPAAAALNHARRAVHLMTTSMDRSAGHSLGLKPGTLLRRLLLRALWPYLEDRRRFDAEVVDALIRMQRHGPPSRGEST